MELPSSNEKHLLETFDDIYILDLHGNSRKREITDGGKDENVLILARRLNKYFCPEK